ncbi:beta-amylase 3, chloroplastic-like [Canna indica]|uniref:Beta-amylase n=1 Tax=Canna indica TaxID=4628 RepID=A0AAQ3KNR5_9LILI|nr:beta-amylase 3, chloroplastic-like [Canna indica]
MTAMHAPRPPPTLAAARPHASPSSVAFQPPVCLLSGHRLFSPLRLAVSSRLHSSNPCSSSSGANGSLEGSSSSSSSGDSSSSSSSSSSGDGGELYHGLPPPRSGKGAPVFVTLPPDAVGPSGQMTRRKTMGASFMALTAAGVEGIVVECWWGIVEREAPEVYDWGGYMDLVMMARRYGLKVRAIMAFHQWGTGPGDPGWIPLPRWVLEEMDKEPDLAFSDRFGRRNKEYISLGCDVLPILRGRTPIQAYSDLMRSFRDTFRDFLGAVITEIQVGMGPAGELRYPSFPTEKLIKASAVAEIGEFQCYDKYMLASLGAQAHNVGMHEWGYGGPLGASNSLQNPDETGFFRSDGSWNMPYGQLFLEWYSGLLLLHGERLCMVTDAIFWGTGVKISAKVAVIHWYYDTSSHPSELTAGYYNTLIRDGYLPIARMFARYRMALCCTCFDMQDSDERSNPQSSPEGFLRQLIYAARKCNLPITGENSFARLDEASLNQVVKNSRLYYSGAYEASLSFNYVRMNKNLFDPHNWNRFTRFVKRMSDNQTFRAKLDIRRSDSYLSPTSTIEEIGRSLVCH